jgi:hypothetical protein
MKKYTAILLMVLLGGCANDFQKLVDTVKVNCHTTIDAQVAGGLMGVTGSGHFQQECWPLKETVSEVSNAVKQSE